MYSYIKPLIYFIIHQQIQIVSVRKTLVNMKLVFRYSAL